MKRFVMAFILLVALLLHIDSGYSAKIATLEKREERPKSNLSEKQHKEKTTNFLLLV